MIANEVIFKRVKNQVNESIGSKSTIILLTPLLPSVGPFFSRPLYFCTKLCSYFWNLRKITNLLIPNTGMSYFHNKNMSYFHNKKFTAYQGAFFEFLESKSAFAHGITHNIKNAYSNYVSGLLSPAESWWTKWKNVKSQNKNRRPLPVVYSRQSSVWCSVVQLWHGHQPESVKNNTDPDPSKWYGSRRVRIHNTSTGSILQTLDSRHYRPIEYRR